MIAQWPPKPRYESAKRLNDAITIAKLGDAINELAESMRKAAQVNSDLADKIRDDLAALEAAIDESDRP